MEPTMPVFFPPVPSLMPPQGPVPALEAFPIAVRDKVREMRADARKMQGWAYGHLRENRRDMADSWHRAAVRKAEQANALLLNSDPHIPELPRPPCPQLEILRRHGRVGSPAR